MKTDIGNYLTETFGIKANQRGVDESIHSRLPIFISQGYNFSLFEINDIPVLLVERKSDSQMNIAQIQKQLILINERTSLRTIWITSHLSTYQRKKCIEEQINFIIPYNQIYLPDLMINLTDMTVKKAPNKTILLPSTQLLILYHLQIENITGLSFTEISKKLEYSKKTISLIADDLKAKDLCQLRGTKEKFFEFKSNGSLLWKEVEPFMQNPVSKRFFFTQEKHFVFPISGDEALSHFTFISETGQSSIAIGKQEFEKLNQTKYWKNINQFEGNCSLEVWKYNPRLLCKDGFIDPLSLYLCFRESNDERVTSEMHQFINNSSWLKG